MESKVLLAICLRLDEAVFDEVVDDRHRSLIHRQIPGDQLELGRGRGLVRSRDAGKLRDLTGTGLLEEALRVALLA
jgi:hypothetical protein